MQPGSERSITIEELRRLHPMPWKYQVGEPGTQGNVIVTDINNNVVPLFVLLGLVVKVTQSIAQRTTAA